MMKQKVTVVIPAHHEEKTIAGVISSSKKYCDEVIVALSKRSNDKTEEIARSLGVKIIRDNGLGKGEGMRCAINTISDGIVVFIDADGSHITKDMPKLIKPLQNNEADMVLASRFLGGSEELHGTFGKFLRMFLSMSIAQIINWRFKTAIGDTQNGYRAIKVSVVKDLKLESNIFDIETEMVMKCYKKGYTILEVPSRELKRCYGESGIKLTKVGFRYLTTVLRNL
ncbi:MAG: glycosyltransferase family 2 protein [DPANN group archaeon]|nr:glycosyltransferase family 2 protein [DPANN group archaeon]